MRLFCSLFLLICTTIASAHFDRYGDDYRVHSPAPQAMEAAAAEFEVLRKTPAGFDFYVPHAKLARFKQLLPMAVRLPGEQTKALDLADYRTYESVGNELRQLAQDYPQLVKLETYGRTRSGHALYALKISDNVALDEDEPELMITSATHGDELITVEVLMALVKELLSSYGKNQRLSRMLSENELYILPMVNPEGYARRSRYAGGWTDPNRDYPWPEQAQRESIDCIDAQIKFFHAHNFKGSLDIHASGKMVMYPWAYTREAPAAEDERNFDYLVKSMAEQNGYAAGQISKVIYVAKGSSADYYYWKNKTTAIAVELTTSKAPPMAQVPRVIDEAREMVWRFIENF